MDLLLPANPPGDRFQQLSFLHTKTLDVVVISMSHIPWTASHGRRVAVNIDHRAWYDLPLLKSATLRMTLSIHSFEKWHFNTGILFLNETIMWNISNIGQFIKNSHWQVSQAAQPDSDRCEALKFLVLWTDSLVRRPFASPRNSPPDGSLRRTDYMVLSEGEIEPLPGQLSILQIAGEPWPGHWKSAATEIKWAEARISVEWTEHSRPGRNMLFPLIHIGIWSGGQRNFQRNNSITEHSQQALTKTHSENVVNACVIPLNFKHSSLSTVWVMGQWWLAQRGQAVPQLWFTIGEIDANNQSIWEIRTQSRHMVHNKSESVTVRYRPLLSWIPNSESPFVQVPGNRSLNIYRPTLVISGYELHRIFVADSPNLFANPNESRNFGFPLNFPWIPSNRYCISACFGALHHPQI
jgi:hypothetical protein